MTHALTLFLLLLGLAGSPNPPLKSFTSEAKDLSRRKASLSSYPGQGHIFWIIWVESKTTNLGCAVAELLCHVHETREYNKTALRWGGGGSRPRLVMMLVLTVVCVNDQRGDDCD